MPTSDLLGFNTDRVWDTEAAFLHLKASGLAESKRTAERTLQRLRLLPPELNETGLLDELSRPANPLLMGWALNKWRAKRKRVFFVQLHDLPDGRPCLHANDARGARYWIPLFDAIDSGTLIHQLHRLQQEVGRSIVIVPHGELLRYLRQQQLPEDIAVVLHPFLPVLDVSKTAVNESKKLPDYLKQLEAESIHFIREAVAEADKPAMLYSVGKDSAVMLHLIRKAFYPAPPPMPLLHIDSRWKFQETYLFRDHMAQLSGMDLLVYVNPELIEKDINPFIQDADTYNDITRSAALRKAIDRYRFDLLFSGSRRDDEPSRATERFFSFRTATHAWEARQQRPEIWRLYNAKKQSGESVRAFPLSNWTEFDIWHYIYHESIPVVPLYFARERPVVNRNGQMLLVDDHRFALRPDEKIEELQVRFKSLGCYPLTSAVPSSAASVADILAEMLQARANDQSSIGVKTKSTAKIKGNRL